MLLRRLILPAISAAVTCLFAPAAQAAYFTAEPFPFQRSGAGPFQWMYRSSDPGGSQGTVAYRLSTESVWHRCGRDGPAPALSNLPEGSYGISIADDISLDWYAARGLASSGWTQPCFDGTVTQPNSPVTVSTFYVDGTPPVVSQPTVVVADKTALVSASVADAVSGLRSITWQTGDGTMYRDGTSFRHTFMNYGDWKGSITAEDRSGNVATRDFTVSLPRPATAPPAVPTQTPPLTSMPDRSAPVLSRFGSLAQRLLPRRRVSLTLACSEPCALTAKASLRIGTRRFALLPTGRSLAAGQRTPVRLYFGKAAAAATRRALQRRQRVTAMVTVTATDAAGNSALRSYAIRAVR